MKIYFTPGGGIGWGKTPENTSGVKYISMLENMEKIDFLAGSGCFNDFPGGPEGGK